MPKLNSPLIQSWETFKQVVEQLDIYVDRAIYSLKFYKEEKKTLFEYIDALTHLDSNEAINKQINLIDNQFHRLHECFNIELLKVNSISIIESGCARTSTSQVFRFRTYPKVHAQMLMYIHQQRGVLSSDKPHTPTHLEALFQTIGPIYTYLFFDSLNEQLESCSDDDKLEFNKLTAVISEQLPEHLKSIWIDFFQTCQMEILSASSNSFIIKVAKDGDTNLLKIKKPRRSLSNNIANGFYLAEKLRTIEASERPPFDIVLSQPMIFLDTDSSIHTYITPYVPKRDLACTFDDLREHPDGSERILETIDDVAKALFDSLNFMEDKGFFYADSKPSNWLFRQDDAGIRLGLSDLKSIYLTEDQKSPSGNSIWTTVSYIPPEIYPGIKNIDVKKFHSYVMGMLLLRLLFGYRFFLDVTPDKPHYRLSRQKLMNYVDAQDPRTAILSQPKGKKYFFLMKELTNITLEHRPCVAEARAFLTHLDNFSEKQLGQFSIYKDYYQIAEKLGLDVSKYEFPKLESLWNAIEYPFETIKQDIINKLITNDRFLSPILVKTIQDRFDNPELDIISKISLVEALKGASIYKQTPVKRSAYLYIISLLSQKSFVENPQIYVNRLNNLNDRILIEFSYYVSYYQLVENVYKLVKKIFPIQLIDPYSLAINMQSSNVHMLSIIQSSLKYINGILSEESLLHKYKDLNITDEQKQYIHKCLVDDHIELQDKLLLASTLEALLQARGKSEHHIYELLLAACCHTQGYPDIYSGYQIALTEALTAVVSPDIDEETSLAYSYLIKNIADPGEESIAPKDAETYVISLSELDKSTCHMLNDYMLYYNWAKTHCNFDMKPFSLLAMPLSNEHLIEQLSLIKDMIVQDIINFPYSYDFLQTDERHPEMMLEVLPALNVCELINQALKRIESCRQRFFYTDMADSIYDLKEALKQLTLGDIKVLNDLNREALVLDRPWVLPERVKCLFEALNKCHDSIKDDLKEANNYIRHFSSLIEQYAGLDVTQEEDALNPGGTVKYILI